jgi:hypothetical protein
MLTKLLHGLNIGKETNISKQIGKFKTNDLEMSPKDMF